MKNFETVHEFLEITTKARIVCLLLVFCWFVYWIA
jgi:hypothetical protein